MFEIYDSKAEAYLTPWFSPTAATALRSFEQAAQDESKDFHRHAADYTLFEVAEWDERTGDVVPHAAKVNLGCAIEFLKPAPMMAPVRSE